MENIVIKKDTFKRIIKDVKEIVVSPLTEQNIFYKHDEDNMLIGYAMIIGPKDSCYTNGFFFFKFEFPTNYPWSPPKVIYSTNDGKTRFNPNLYRDGKVCLSILNTWKGEAWSSCQTIKSILLTLLTVLNDKPLLNEPGVTEYHDEFHKYNEIITYKSYEYALLRQYQKNNNEFERFRENMKTYVAQNKSEILQELNKNQGIIKNKYGVKSLTLSVRIYGLETTIDYTNLINLVTNI